MYRPSERMQAHLRYVYGGVPLWSEPQGEVAAQIAGIYEMCYPEPEVIPDGE